MPRVAVITEQIVSPDRDLADCCVIVQEACESRTGALESQREKGREACGEGRGGRVLNIWNQHVCLQEEGRGGGVKGSARVSFQSAVLLTASDRYFIRSKLPRLKA